MTLIEEAICSSDSVTASRVFRRVKQPESSLPARYSASRAATFLGPRVYFAEKPGVMIDFSFNLSIRLGMAAGERIQITTASRSQGCTPGESEWLVECANRTAVLVYCSQTGMARAFTVPFGSFHQGNY